MKRATLKTISDESGFSITTVSRALAGYDDVNEQTRQRIIEIAQRLGYQPNLTARHLRSKHTNTIGMVIPLTAHYSDLFFMELLSGVGQQAAQYGYDLLLSAQVPGEEELSAYRRMVDGSRVDGMVLARVRRHDARIDYLKGTAQPYVVFGHSGDDDYPYIDVDGEKGIRQMVHHFADYGHRRIALIAPPDELAFAAPRVAGYWAALEELGLPHDPALVVTGDLSMDSGAVAAERLLSLPDPPTAIMACNDQMALGAMAAITTRGLRVGRDVAVSGFDDIPAAASASPPLTTIRQPIYQIGQRLAQTLIRLIHGETVDNLHVLLEPELVIRASSGEPRSG